MKHKLNILVAFLLISITASAQYTYQRKLSEVTQTGWYRFELPPAMFTKVKSNFDDLRIYVAGNDSTEIAYLFRIAADEIIREQVKAEPFNISRQGTTLYFSVKLNVESVNQATLHFVQDNYDADVTVEGSNDQKEWFTIQTGRIIAINQPPVNYKYNQINFPQSAYTFLRFSVKNNTALTLSQVNFYQIKTTRGSFSEVSSTLSTKTIDKQTELLVKFDQPVLLSRLSIATAANQLFYRNMAIDWLYDSIVTETGTRYQYRSLYSGVISSFKQDTLLFDPQVVSKIKVTIYNADNPPVQIDKILAWSPQVEVLTHLQPGQYELRYGNAKAYAPRYDLQHFVKELPDLLPELQVSSELKPEQITTPETSPWFKNKLWMWGALAVIVTILGFFTIRMLREQ